MLCSAAVFHVAVCAAVGCLIFLSPASASVDDWRDDTKDITDVPNAPGYKWPAFTNWDCQQQKAIVDWDELYSTVEKGIRSRNAAGEPYFDLPDMIIDTLLNPDKARAARDECPMGTLYFLTLYTYEVVLRNGGAAATAQAQALVQELRLFPFFVIAGSRWPTYEALNYFSYLHTPQNPKAARHTLCEGVRGASGIDWDSLLSVSKSWSDEQLGGLEPGQGTPEFGRAIKAAADQVYQDASGAGAAAQNECPFGFLFLCVTQVLAAAMRLTGNFDNWAHAVDRILADLPYYSVAGSQWPTFRMLAMFSSLSKGEEVQTLGNFQNDVHRWGGKHPVAKRFRHYGDLRLSVDELAPLGRDAAGWGAVNELVGIDGASWYAFVVPKRVSGVGKIFGEALDAALVAVRASSLPFNAECGFSGISADACRGRGCHWVGGDQGSACQVLRPSRKTILVTFVWGESWAPLVPRFVAWAVKLSLHVIIVAMGDACRLACEAATSAVTAASGVSCWDPLRGSAGRHAERGSIVQRHAMVHILLHLGVDVLAFDFDTFFFTNPLPRLQAVADEHDADILMTRHLDGDCLNMGLVYIRASSRTAEWYSKYLEWFHQHLFEREQRGMNAILKFTNQKVSFPPTSMPAVKAVALDDHNEFSSSRGGWLGDWSKLIFFHWVNPVRTLHNWAEIKVSDLKSLYEVGLHPTTDIRTNGGNGSLANLLAIADGQTMFAPVRGMMETMIVSEAPHRESCW